MFRSSPLWAMKLLLGLGVLGWCLCCSSVLLAEDTTDPLIQHLEFLGYQCDLTEGGIRARHSAKLHLFLTFYHGGIRVQTGFPGKSLETDSDDRFALINELNRRTRVARFYWSQDGHLFGGAWIPGMYDKSRFAVFLEAWEHDTNIFRQAHQNLTPYLQHTQSGHVQDS